MRFQIVNIAVKQRSGTNDKGPWEMHEQEAYLHTGRPFPTLCSITIPKAKGGQPYPVGEYDLDETASIEVGNYGRLQFSREIHLVPVAASADSKRVA